MKLNPKYLLLASVLILIAPAYTAFAADEVYGSQLMTEQERNAYRTKMQSMKTEQERQQLRMEHHKQMQERAKAQGVTLPDMPPNQGMHQGMGQGMGQGMHQGMGQQGMGQGMQKGMGQQGSGGKGK